MQEHSISPVNGESADAAPRLDTSQAAVGAPAAAEYHAVPAGMCPKEAKNMTKILNKEEKREDKNIKNQVKEISNAEKLEHRAEKADEKAIKRHEQAIKAEHAANKELERAQAKHDQAVREAQKTQNEIALKQEHHTKVSSGLQNAKAHLDQLTHARKSHHTERSTKLVELESIVNSAT